MNDCKIACCNRCCMWLNSFQISFILNFLFSRFFLLISCISFGSHNARIAGGLSQRVPRLHFSYCNGIFFTSQKPRNHSIFHEIQLLWNLLFSILSLRGNIFDICVLANRLCNFVFSVRSSVHHVWRYAHVLCPWNQH